MKSDLRGTIMILKQGAGAGWTRHGLMYFVMRFRRQPKTLILGFEHYLKSLIPTVFSLVGCKLTETLEA